MLRIGDFSKLTQVSIRMLRHYDEIGLLKPSQVDKASGYRYYSSKQLPRLYRILALQDLGFSLKYIIQLIEQPLSAEQLRGMLLQKQAEIEDRLQAERERLARVSARLYQLDNEGKGVDVLLKQVPSQWVASVRDSITHHGNVDFLFERLFAHLAPLRIQGLTAVIWHNDSFVAEDIDAEAMMYLSQAIPPSQDVTVYELPSCMVASVVHHGSYRHLPTAYDALTRWLDISGYQIIAPNRELYLHYGTPVQADDESYVTEIQFPITRVED
jgi:DNA-binding transcriptional MerR regulator